MNNFFKVAVASVGAAMVAPVVSELYTEYVSDTSIGSFLVILDSEQNRQERLRRV